MSKTTSYSISGINPATQEVETLLEVGYDNNQPSMWGNAYNGGGGSGSSTTIETRNPTTSDVGSVGDYWYNKNTNTMYICTSADPVSGITNLTGRIVTFNDSIFVPDEDVEYSVTYKKEGQWETTYEKLLIGSMSAQLGPTTVYAYGLFYDSDGYSFDNQFITGSSLDAENYTDVSGSYNKTVEIISGSDASNQGFVDYIKENATILNSGYIWSEVSKDKMKTLNPVTDGNVVIGFTSSGGGQQYINAGGTTNLLIAENNDIDPADYIQRYSYENVLVGTYGNKIGTPDTTTSSASLYNNVIVGQNNHVGTQSNSSTYGNLVVGYGNDVYGSSGFGASIIVGTGNGFNANAGCCFGRGNNVNGVAFEEWGGTGGYSKNVIGSFNTINAGSNNTTTVVGNSNTADTESVILGINNTVNSYTNPVGGIVSILGDTNTTKYCTAGSIVGYYNTVGDNTEQQGDALTVHSLIGRGNTVTSLGTTSSGKTNTLGVDSYAVDGSFNTIAGSETVIGHNNIASLMSTVVGNYNNLFCGRTKDDPSESDKFRLIGLCIGDWNTSASGGSDFIIGRNNTAGSGSYQIMGDNVNCQGGSAAIGYNIVINSGSFAMGSSISHSSGGGCTYIGKNIESRSSSVIIGADIKAGYMDGSTPVSGRSGTYVGSNLSGSGSGYNVTIMGTYNSDDLTAEDIFVLADGSYSARHNLMVGDYNHNVTFSNNVYAENIPASPSVEGTYTLQCVVDGSGNKTYSWV